MTRATAGLLLLLLGGLGGGLFLVTRPRHRRRSLRSAGAAAPEGPDGANASRSEQPRRATEPPPPQQAPPPPPRQGPLPAERPDARAAVEVGMPVIGGPPVAPAAGVALAALDAIAIGPEREAEAQALNRDAALAALAQRDLERYAAHTPRFISRAVWDYYPPPYRRGNLTVWPLAFGAPEESWVQRVPRKDQYFAQSDPRVSASYKWGASWRGGGGAGDFADKARQEKEYYTDYMRSLFAITMKKKGWDCFRHYEILACGALPCFLDIAAAPAVGALVHLPRDFLRSLLSFPGVDCHQKKVDTAVFNRSLWHAMAEEMLIYGRARLTTRQLARYMLRSAGLPNATKVLFVTLGPMGGPYASDYGRDFMLHGFRRLLGPGCVDVLKLPYMYSSSSIRDARYSGTITVHQDGRSGMWGGGFGYSRRLFDSPAVNRSEVERRIRQREFDAVILSDVGTRSSLADDPFLRYHVPYPLLDVIRAAYRPSEVLLFYASDLLVRREHAERVRAIGIPFVREFGGDADLAPYRQRNFDKRRRRR